MDIFLNFFRTARITFEDFVLRKCDVFHLFKIVTDNSCKFKAFQAVIQNEQHRNVSFWLQLFRLQQQRIEHAVKLKLPIDHANNIIHHLQFLSLLEYFLSPLLNDLF